MASTDPRTATQGQWEDLVDRVQSKAEIGSVLSTPSDVEYVGTDNIADAAVTTDKIAEGAVSADKAGFTTYSVDEQVVGKWIDGKTIYRKCFTGTINITAGTRVNVTLSANSGIENLIDAGGYMGYYSGTPKGRNIIPSSECNTSGVMTNYIMVYVQAETNDLLLSRFSAGQRGVQPYAVWVEYTKLN